MKSERLEKEIKRNQERLEWIKQIYELLPDDLPKEPTIANEKDNAFFGKAGAWLSFNRSYGEDFTGSDILTCLENAGWKSIPASLVKWDNYRKGVEPGFADDIPDTKGKYQLTEVEQIAPVFINPANHTDAEAIAFYEAPNSMVFRVKVPAPNDARVMARRKEIKGSWYYERGTAKISHPDSWHSLNLESGECVATLHSVPAWVDTEQGISGRVYWAMLWEPNQFPVTNAEFLRLIENSK